MPIVPTIDPSPSNTPDVSVPGVAPLRDNGSSQQLQQTGAEVETAGLREMRRGNLVAQHIQNQMDDANARAAETKFLQSATDTLHGDKGYMNTQGADAMNNFDATQQALAKAKKDIQYSLGNDVQKQIFDQISQRHMVTLGGQMAEHRAQQRKAYTYNEAVASVDNAVTMTQQSDIGSPDHDMYSAVALNRTQDALSIRGIPADSEEAKKAQRDVTTTIFEKDVNRLLDAHRDDAAKLYYSEHSKDLDPTTPQMVRIKKMIDDTTLANQVQNVVGQVINSGGTFEDQDAKLQAEFKSNPEGLKEARAEHGYRYQVHEAAARKAVDENTGKLWDMRFPSLPGQQPVPMSQIVRSQEWASLDGDKRSAMKAQWEAYSKRNENDPNTQIQRFSTYWAYASKPDDLSKMSDAQIIALTPKMGLAGVQDLLGMKQKLNQPGKVIASDVDTNQLKVFAAQAGLNMYDKPDGDTQGAFGLLKYRTDQQIEIEQQAKKRELTRDEKDTIIKRMVVQYQVLDKGWLWDSTKNKMAFQLEPGDVLTPPDDVRESIINEAHQNGVANPTEDQIRARYFQMKQTQQPSGAGPQPVQRTVVPTKLRR